MSSTEQLITYLRTNYINSKNQYFNFLNNYKKIFWNELCNKLKQNTYKYKIRSLMKINKYFISNKIKNDRNIIKKKKDKNITNQSTITNQTTITNQSTIINQSTNNKVIQESNNQSTQQILNNTSLPKEEKKLINISSKSIDTHTQQTDFITENEINQITQDIVKNAKQTMYSKTNNPWCAFKNGISDVFSELSIEFNKVSDDKIPIINSRKIQIINKLLDLYKENYSSYKTLFSHNKELSQDLLINIHNHPLIKEFISSFTDKNNRTKFLNLVNTVIDN